MERGVSKPILALSLLAGVNKILLRKLALIMCINFVLIHHFPKWFIMYLKEGSILLCLTKVKTYILIDIIIRKLKLLINLLELVLIVLIKI